MACIFYVLLVLSSISLIFHYKTPNSSIECEKPFINSLKRKISWTPSTGKEHLTWGYSRILDIRIGSNHFFTFIPSLGNSCNLRTYSFSWCQSRNKNPKDLSESFTCTSVLVKCSVRSRMIIFTIRKEVDVHSSEGALPRAPMQR